MGSERWVNLSLEMVEKANELGTDLGKQVLVKEVSAVSGRESGQADQDTARGNRTKGEGPQRGKRGVDREAGEL